MTNTNDVFEQVAGNGLLHRRLFLTQGAALLGAGATLLAARPAHAAPLDVPPWTKTPGAAPSVYSDRSRFEESVQRVTERVARHRRHGRLANAARAPRRHHHAELIAFRAPSQRRAGHRSRAASVVDPRARGAAAVVRHECVVALSARLANPVSRVLRQQRRAEQSGAGAAIRRWLARPRVVQRVDRCAARHPARGSGRASGRALAARRGRRRGRDEPQRADGEGARRCDRRDLPERRTAAAR